MAKKTDTVKKTSKRKDASKKKKDPLAPKRALSSFIIFSRETRPIVIAENPNMKFAEVTREVSLRWNAIANDEKAKAVWEEEAKKDKERYEKEKAEYDAKKTNQSEDDEDDEEGGDE